MNYIFLDTNVIIKIYETKKLFKIFNEKFVNSNIPYITSVSQNEFNVIIKRKNIFSSKKYDDLFSKLRIFDCKQTYKVERDNILYRDFINCPPHRQKMGKKEYQDNHRDTLIWLGIIDFAKTIKKNSKSKIIFYTNDNDFLRHQNYLIDEFYAKTTKDIKICNFYPLEIFKETYINSNTIKIIEFNDIKEWFSTFLNIINKYDDGETRNQKEVLEIVKLFLRPTIYKQHPISYLLKEYNKNTPKNIDSYLDRECILFYKKITDQLFLKKFKQNGKDVFDKNTIDNIENNFKYLH